jgi:hypothetical protein
VAAADEPMAPAAATTIRRHQHDVATTTQETDGLFTVHGVLPRT